MVPKPYILVVDDEVDFAENVSELIRATGKYDSSPVFTARDGLKFLDTQPVRLILLDIKMPDVDGFQFLEQIRSNPKTKKIGVIFLTAWADSELVEKAQVSKVEGYLKKPLKEEQLINAVDRYFSGGETWMIPEGEMGSGGII